MNRVLVVNSDAATRVRLTVELGKDVVLFAESDADARAVIRTMPEVVATVLDLDLSRGRLGLELLEFVRARSPRCVRVVVTTRRYVVLEGDATLVDAVFGKPWIAGTLDAFLTARLTA